MATNRIESLDPAMIRPGRVCHLHSLTQMIFKTLQFQPVVFLWMMSVGTYAFMAAYNWFLVLARTHWPQDWVSASGREDQAANLPDPHVWNQGCQLKQYLTHVHPLSSFHDSLRFCLGFTCFHMSYCRGKMTLADDVNLEEFVVAKATSAIQTAFACFCGILSAYICRQTSGN